MSSELRQIFEQKTKRFKSDKEFLQEIKKVIAKDKFFEKNNEFYQLMGGLCESLNCSFDIFVEILVHYASKAYLNSKKVTQGTQLCNMDEFSNLLTQAFESPLQVDKKSKDIQDFDEIRHYCIQQFQNVVPLHTKKVGIFIEKILKTYNSFKQKFNKKPQKILQLYQKMSFQSQRQDVEFRIQCFQALIAILIQRLIIRLDKRQDYYLADEYSFIEYMLNQHKELYFVLIKSLEQTIKIQNEPQVHIIKALQLLIVPFLTQDQFNFWQWWNNDQAQITVICEFMNTFKTQAPVKFNEFTSKCPKLLPSHYHFNLLCYVLQQSQSVWSHFLNFKIQFDHDDLLKQCFLLKFRVGFMKSISRLSVKSITTTDSLIDLDKTLQFRTKDKFHIFAKLCYMLYMRMCNQEKRFFRDKDCSQYLELIPYLGVFSLDLVAFNSVKVLDTAEIEHISYKFHLYDKRAYLNQGLFELIKNMVFQIHNNPSNKVLLKITTDMIKKTIYKFPTQTVIFAQKFPLVVKNFYNYITKNLQNENVPQLLFLLIFVSSMNKYTFVALIQSILETLVQPSDNTQSSPFTNQQEALFKEIGLKLTNLNLNSQPSPPLVVDLNRSLMAIFMSDKPYKCEHLPKKIRQMLEDGKLILDFRFENFNYQKTYRKYARIAFQYFIQENGFTIVQYTNLQTSFDDLGGAMNKLTHRKSKFLEFFKQVYGKVELLHYINTVIIWKDYQECDILNPLSRLYLMLLCMEIKKSADIKFTLLVFQFLSETILPPSFKLLFKNIDNFKESNLRLFTSILNQWINLNTHLCFQRSIVEESSLSIQNQNKLLQNKLNIIFFDELHNVKDIYHTVKKILIQP